MAKIDIAKRMYWNAKVKEAQDQARAVADNAVGPMPWTIYVAEWRWQYRRALREIMAGVKL